MAPSNDCEDLPVAVQSLKFKVRSTIIVFVAALLLFSADVRADPWPPPDPNQRDTTVVFSMAWVRQAIFGFQTLADLQRAAGTGGKIIEQSDGDDPMITVSWRSMTDQGVGYMVATVGPTGTIGVSIITVNEIRIVLNNRGGIICDQCEPPIDIER